MNNLTKSITLTRGVGLILNIVIGAGLLALPGLVVEQAGDHSFWSWVVCAVVAIPLLLTFIIMGSRFPNAGGIAHICEMALGKLGYIVASLIFLGAVTFGLPAIALTGGYYISEVMAGDPTVYAAALVAMGAFAHIASVEMAGRISTTIASGVLVTLLCFLVLGFSVVEWDGVGENTASLMELDTNVLFAPFMMIFFAFTGWEVVAGISEEFIDPKRDFPRAMILSFIVACLLYFSMAFVVQNSSITGSYEASFTSIANVALGEFGKIVVTILAGFIIFANLMGAIWAVSRMVFSLSRESYLPLTLRTNERGVPFSAVVLTTLVLLVVLFFDWLGLLTINNMLALAGQNFLLLYGMTGIALFRLSKRLIDRVIASLTIIIVVSLIFTLGISLLYPIGLTLFGVVVWKTGNFSNNEIKSA